ncbi:alginate O-acetyltransferase AlgF [Deinococcus cellulosilyticus]|uniref:Alginate biosynthesis protein AlgF n=1 Tax=Deinococcus cellulosilyticus (strain DSM 18568 / NBRC 106333 / KACC 11606 / 5516J-15) TaxID=1223518 RepID=A0A511N3I2_DEIC1|nr:alginate O-acetyltransferase AlgF [Deinococcus cellulosilyticus]GEM47008.1 alginate biosynthesis protein AlgF [Deinococcus cellulosilyticus NBRC 106333 = KACC 11606]
MKPKDLLVRIISLGVVMGTVASAQEGLYDPAPPANSAFVRVFNPEKTGVDVAVDKKTYGKINAFAASSYQVIPEGNRTLTFNKENSALKFTAGKYYTLVLQANQVAVLEDVANTNRAKALITVYNLSDSKNLSLKTADGKVTVLKDIEVGKSKSQAVNGIKVALSVLNDTKAIEAFKETQLERGAAYSVFVTGSKGNYRAVWVQSTTTTK